MTTETQNKQLLTVYNHFYKDRFGGLQDIHVWQHGNCLEEAKKDMTQTRDLWLSRYAEALDKNDTEAVIFTKEYAEEYEREIKTLRVITVDEYSEQQKNLILTGEKEISEDVYWEMLECLPPLKMTKNGFIMSEFYTCSYTRQFFKRDGKFYMKMIDYKNPKTWAVL